jgi:catechol 2,3-dioxygenase-like lactoylglutathione lyase family enzyme
MLQVTEVGTVFVPVSDQERALAFYVGTLGWEQTGDFEYGGGHRWVEVAPKGTNRTIALVPPSEGSSPGGDVVRCSLTTTDIEADLAFLCEHGVDVDGVVSRQGTSRPGLVDRSVTVPDTFPPQLCFRDPDGNAYLLVEPPPA